MKSAKLVIVSVLVALGALSAIFSASCSKNGCKGVTCLNYGSCEGGICQCDSGIGGPTCAIVYRNLYAHTYVGNGTDDSGHQYVNNSLIFTTGTDTTNYNNMNLTWDNPGGNNIVFNGIVLSNNLSTGSNFTLDTMTVDSVFYQGTGTVNGNVASLIITETIEYNHPNTQLVITLNNLNVQQ